MTKSDVILRQATLPDARAFYGKDPEYSFKGFVVDYAGAIIGIFGVYFTKQGAVAFSEMKPEMRNHRRAIAKCCRKAMELVDGLNRRVYAVASSTEPTAPYLLVKLGFKPTGVFGPEGEVLVRG